MTEHTTKYGPDVYRPERAKPMPEGSTWIYYTRHFYKTPKLTLPWGHYYEREQADTVMVRPPVALCEDLVTGLNQEKRPIPPPKKYWPGQLFPAFRIWNINHQQMEHRGLRLLPLLVYFFSVAYGTCFLAGKTLLLISPPGEYSTLPMKIGILIPTVFIIFASTYILVHYFTFPPRYILNRASGMILKHRFLLPPIKEPFTHFDALLVKVDGKDAYMGLLVCRYRRINFTFTGRYEEQNSIYLRWQFIQRFMDVTQPLPDIPALGPYRHLDPVTAEHDKKTGRAERYWRDKSMGEINRLAAKMEKEEYQFPPVWPCTMAPFIEGRNPDEPMALPIPKPGKKV